MAIRIPTAISSPLFEWIGHAEVDAMERWSDLVMDRPGAGQIQPDHPFHDGRV